MAYAFEACWHRPPGGTAVAAVEIARHLGRDPGVELVGVAARHRSPAPAGLEPPVPVVSVPGPRAAVYEAWTRLGRPSIDRFVGPVDLAHATAPIPMPTAAPLVVTMHDLAFRRRPDQFPRRGRSLLERALAVARRRAAAIITSSERSRADLVEAGFAEPRVHVVPLGVDPRVATDAEVEEARRAHALPPQFALFVGTLEPRKNLRRLVSAMAGVDLPLVVVGPDGWGDAVTGLDRAADVRFLGSLRPDDLRALYAAASVFAYPSEHEGFGLPVLEAMAQGTPVVTSAGTSTEEVAGGAAVLVDPFDPDAIRAGIVDALGRRAELAAAGRRRAEACTWAAAAAATARVYRQVARR